MAVAPVQRDPDLAMFAAIGKDIHDPWPREFFSAPVTPCAYAGLNSGKAMLMLPPCFSATVTPTMA